MGDERFVALLKSMRANGATSAELGKVALEAIDSGWEIATLARAIGVYHRAVQKWIEAYHANGNGVVNVRGRRSE
ncbi:MAG: hypothetical protein NZ531_00450, partial [Aquificaceae bacterium]|nr:hypothetical protein [Aquificaceae bacterium]